ARALERARSPALDVAPDRHAVIAAVDPPAVQLALLRPAELLEAARERARVVAAVARGLAADRRALGQRVGHLGARHEVAAAEFRAVDAQVAGGEVEQALAEEVGLEAARRAVGARRGLVRE